jgi:DNA-damage-inducible protein J
MGGVFMSASNINIRVDSRVKSAAQEVFASLGLDMTTAINIFLRQSILHKGIPFQLTIESVQKTPKLGGWEGKIWMADDFDAPLDDFKEYME